MLQTWDADADKRPSFSQLVSIIGDFLEANVKQVGINPLSPWSSHCADLPLHCRGCGAFYAHKNFRAELRWGSILCRLALHAVQTCLYIVEVLGPFTLTESSGLSSG